MHKYRDTDTHIYIVMHKYRDTDASREMEKRYIQRYRGIHDCMTGYIRIDTEIQRYIHLRYMHTCRGMCIHT